MGESGIDEAELLRELGISDALLEADAALRKAKVKVARVFRFYPPRDTGEEAEVVFTTTDGKPHTAFLRGDIVTRMRAGW